MARYDITTFSDTETVEIEVEDLTLEQRLNLMCGKCPYTSEPEPCGDYEPLNGGENILEKT